MDPLNTVPVFLLFAILAGLAAALLGMSRLLTPRQFIGPVQKMPYESGMDPIHDTRRRFDVRFHLIAIAFLVFDVEVLFLYPWAVAAKKPEPVATASASQEKANAEVSQASAVTPAAGSQPYNISRAVSDGLVTDRNLVFGGVAVFFVLLALGFVYDWRKGVFQWR